MTHGTHGPQWIADENRKAEKMTDKIDTSSEAVRLHSPYHDGSMVLDNDGGWVSIDDYRALSARVAELEDRNGWAENDLEAAVEENTQLQGRVSQLEQRNVALGEAVAYAEQRAATLEAKLAEADAWQEAVFAAHPNIDLDIENKENGT